MFTKEDIDKLRKYEKYFNMVKGGYIRGSTRAERAEIREIYDKAYPDDRYHYNDSCSACILSLFRRVSKAYEEIVQEELEPTPTEAPAIGKTKNKATKKEQDGS